MKQIVIHLWCVLMMQPLCAQTIHAPVTRKESKVFTEHGNARTDNYFWLNDPLDSNVINHLKDENAYVSAYMKHTEALQKKLYNEIVARIPGKDVSLPVKQNGYWYYSRFEEENQYPFLARKKGTTTGKEEMVLNIPALAKNHQVFLLRGSSVSPDNIRLAYGVDTSGDRRSILYFKNLASGGLYTDRISNTSGDYEWTNDNNSLYYVLNDHTVRAYKVMRHRLGSDISTDEEIYTENDSTYILELSKSKNDKYIFIHSGSTNTSEDRYIDPEKPNAVPVIIQPRITDVEYSTNYYEGDVFHIYTNKDARNFKLVAAPVGNPTIGNWKDVIPSSDTAFLENTEVLKDYYLAQVKENGLAQIKIFDRTNNTWKKVNFGEEDYVAEMHMATDNYASDSIRYYFTSLKTPASEFFYSLKTGQKKRLKKQSVGGAYNTGLYVTKRLWFKSSDGTKVPLSIVYRRDKFKKDGRNPLLLYAYGSYGYSIDPAFSPAIVSLLDRGISYAIAHIRGGQEMGRNWFEQGRLLNKKNTFNDFIDAARFLVNEKYTSPDKLFANGASAGGMLMGAVINLRPDLFRGVIAEVPWMDVITDMFNTDLPLTTLEYDQWGDPNKQEYYDYLLTWSPLDNVRPAKYPAILATGGLNDTQVPYFSPAKWVAKIRESNLSYNPVLFKVNMGAGHGGESGRYERQKLTAFKYAFILDQLGRTNKPPM